MIEQLPPPVVADADWTPTDPFPRLDAARSFVSGDPDGGRLRVSYFVRGCDQRLVGRAWFGPGSEGPPGHAHGGSISAVLDEAMGGAAWLAGFEVVAVKLTTEFRRMVPLGTDAMLEAWLHEVEGRKVRTRGRLLDENGASFADAEGLFVLLTREQLEHLRRRGL